MRPAATGNHIPEQFVHILIAKVRRECVSPDLNPSGTRISSLTPYGIDASLLGTTLRVVAWPLRKMWGWSYVTPQRRALSAGAEVVKRPSTTWPAWRGKIVDRPSPEACGKPVNELLLDEGHIKF